MSRCALSKQIVHIDPNLWLALAAHFIPEILKKMTHHVAELLK